MTPRPVPCIKSSSVRILKPTHPDYQIPLRCLNHRMIVIVHQNPRVHQPPCLAARFSQGLDQAVPIILIVHNALPSIPCRHDMVKRSGILNPWLPSHPRYSLLHAGLSRFVPDPNGASKIKRLGMVLCPEGAARFSP